MTKRIPAILAALMLALVFTSAPAEQQKDFSTLNVMREGEMTPIEAVVASSANGVSHLTNTADDYEIPQGVYFNGAGVKIIAVVNTLGNYPLELGDERQLWAKVVIGENEQFGGIIGLMPLINLSPELEAGGKLPEGVLDTEARLMADNGLTEAVLGTFGKGTALRVLGWFPDWMQVEILGQTGFVRHEQVKLSEDAEARMSSALPVGYDEIQPGYQERHEEYMTALMKLYDKYGDSNHWPIEISVEASELAQKFGYLFSDLVFIMPGENDLSQEEVLIKAQEAALEYFGLDNWDSISLAYYYEPDDPGAHFWKASLWGTQGTPDVKIWLDEKGEVTGSLNTGDVYADDGTEYLPEMSPEEALAESRGTLEYYLFGEETAPKEQDMKMEEAIEQAWSAFSSNFPDAKREDFTAEASFMTDYTKELSWWLVTLVKEYSPDITILFHQVFLSGQTTPAFQTNPEVYREDENWAEDMMLLKQMEEDKGPMNSWSLEDKAAWEPDYFGLPKDGEKNEEEAVAIAGNEIKSVYELSDTDLAQFDVSTYFVLIPKRSWQIVYFAGESASDSFGPGYTVVIDAATGTVEDIFSNEYTD